MKENVQQYKNEINSCYTNFWLF